MSLVFGSVCSGIEAASVAWRPLGWRAAFLAEIKAFPRAVLGRHHPGVALHSDFTTIQAGQYDAIDLLVGGTPCQSFSVAGLRGGLADERGNLALEYLRLADRLRPAWLVWENVPGVLSSGGGRDFGSFLGGLGQLGYGFAYRVLDAQFFGLAQRRKRVFIVGHLGDWRRAAAVLLEPASLRGDPAPGRGEGEAAAGTLSARASAGGGLGTDFDCSGGLIASVDYTNGLLGGDLAGTLEAAQAKGNRGLGVLAFDTTQIASPGNYSAPQPGDPCHPLAAGAHAPTIAFDWFASRHQSMPPPAECPPLKATMQPAVAFMENQRAEFRLSEQTDALSCGGGKPGQGYAAAIQGSAVRRLTPLECERLQGFPDDYTLVPYRWKPAADGPRYQALGNSMAVPVMRWIGKRIAAEQADIAQHQQAAA